MFSISILTHLYDYDAVNGNLLHRRNARNVKRGTPAGHRYNQKVPYSRVTIYGKYFNLHRLIWIYHYGEIPEGMWIDHINGDGTDNRIENLRLVTPRDNLRNRRRNRNSQNPAFGVQKNPRCNSWSVNIYDKGKPIYVGSFRSEVEAVSARKAAEKKYGYHENHGDRVATEPVIPLKRKA